MRPLSRSERVKNYLIGIGALTGLILGLFSVLKGEPVAEKTWDTLRIKMNEQAKAINRLSRRVVFLQAHEEGRTAAALQAKLEALEKKLETQKPAPAPVKCRKGFVLGDDGKCRRVPKTVAVRVKKVATAAKKELARERKKRKQVEQRERLLDKLLMKVKKSQTQQTENIQPLPARP